MLLIVDSGSSKADWVLSDLSGEEQIEFRTSGINPFFLSEKEIVKILFQTSVLKPYVRKVTDVYFFGAGCSSPDKREVISNALSQVFKTAFVAVENDVAAAIYATCGHSKGLTAILGTGSNVTYFNGTAIEPGIHGLGYILGDEGSGTYFGKKLLTSYLYGTLPDHLQQAFKKKYNPDKSSVIKQVYENKAPNFYLASFAMFMSDFKTDLYITNLLKEGFSEFIHSNIKSFPEHKDLICHFVGSIAYHFSDVLLQVCKENQIVTGKILKHPIEELVSFILVREKGIYNS